MRDSPRRGGTPRHLLTRQHRASEPQDDALTSAHHGRDSPRGGRHHIWSSCPPNGCHIGPTRAALPVPQGLWANGYSTHLRRFWSFWGRYTLTPGRKHDGASVRSEDVLICMGGGRGSWCPPVFHTPISAAQPRSVRLGRGGGRAELGVGLALRSAHTHQPRPIHHTRLRPTPIERGLTCHRSVTCHFRPVFAPVPRLSPWARLWDTLGTA